MLKKLFFVFLIFALGCKKEKDFIYDVPSEFEPIVQKFIGEADTRGQHITINNLIIKYDSTLSNQYCAASNVISSKIDVQKIIMVNPGKCWQNQSQLEALIFHELGHCILGRAHDPSLLPRGDPKSIMYPDDITVYSTCVYSIGGTCDKSNRRVYYVNELFNPSEPVPDWGR